MISQVTIGETRHNFNPKPLIIEAGDYLVGNSKFSLDFFDEDGNPTDRIVVKKIITLDTDIPHEAANLKSLETAKLYLSNCSVLQIDASKLSEEQLLEEEDLKLELKMEIKGYSDDKIRELALLLQFPTDTTLTNTRLQLNRMITDFPRRVKDVMLFDDKKERLLIQKAIEAGYSIEEGGNFKFKGTSMTRIIANTFEAAVATIRDKDNKELRDEIQARVSGFHQGATKANNTIFNGDTDVEDVYKGVAAKITKAIKNGVIEFNNEEYIYMDISLGNTKESVQDILCKPENKALYQSFLEDLTNDK